jgi:hypothetical protein
MKPAVKVDKEGLIAYSDATDGTKLGSLRFQVQNNEPTIQVSGGNAEGPIRIGNVAAPVVSSDHAAAPQEPGSDTDTSNKAYVDGADGVIIGQLQTAQTTVNQHTQALARVAGETTSVVLGAAAVDPTTEVIISGKPPNARVMMQWKNSSRSAVQSVEQATSSFAAMSLPNESLSFGYTATPPALVSMFSDAVGQKYTLSHNPYRAIYDIPVTPTDQVVTSSYLNMFCVYQPTTSTATQTITLCHGLSSGAEIEILNRSANPVTIVAPAAVTNQWAAGVIESPSSYRKITPQGCALIKVYRTGNSTTAPLFFLMGSIQS